jgi:hypothetical protein
VADGRNTKGSSGANRKNRLGKSGRSLLTNGAIDALRRELLLIDKTIAALRKLARLRQGIRSLKGRWFD